MRHCAIVRQRAGISGWKVGDPCYAKQLVTVSHLISWKTVHIPTEPLVLEEVVRKGANVGEYSLLPTFSKVLEERKTQHRNSSLKAEMKINRPVYGDSSCLGPIM